MSVQFGIWNQDGRPVDASHLEMVKALLAPYGPDDGGSYQRSNISILYHAFHTTKESRRERNPHDTRSGNVITWDGRLDNREELIRDLRDFPIAGSADLSIVAAAYERWGNDCFSKLVGDWALAIWNPNNRSLILAKDPIGTRHLYYSLEKDKASWSTILDPLVLLAGRSFALEEEYIAGWLSFFPATQLTPYVGIHSVPPSCFALIRVGKCTVTKYWDFDANKKIRYGSDAEYEEHFRTVFATAVRRRLRSDRPVLAELSGGRDSSSIVCMADTVVAGGTAEASRLDTVSYYDDSEPNWNERPYFTKVEEQRGRTGWHIDIGQSDTEAKADFEPHHRYLLTPCYDGRSSRQISRIWLAPEGYRVLLSGIGGDEVTGGVPTPIPALQDLLATAQLGALAHQLKVWALKTREPWFHLFWEAARGFFPPALVGVPKNLLTVPWIRFSFAKHNRKALTGYQFRVKLLDSPPSFQDSVGTLEGLRRQLACKALSFEPPVERRYPFLDRSLLEFMFAIPREQLVRSTQRRSPMRRALVGIVPDEILNRKHKAFVIRSPLIAISKNWAHFIEMTEQMISGSLGIIDTECMLKVLRKARRGEEVATVALMRAIQIEGWLRNLHTLESVDISMTTKSEWQRYTSASQR